MTPPNTPPANFLISYWYFKGRNLSEFVEGLAYKPRLFADCGAFSAHTQGGTVTVDEYGKWVNQWKHLFEVYPNLDVIHDPVTTIKNQHRLEKEYGLTPIPVFHTGTDWKLLEAYCEKYPYIALGGMVGLKGKMREREVFRRWLDKAFAIARKYDAHFHGFGQTSDWVLRRYPFYSIDSTTWLSGLRYGQCSVWDHKQKRFIDVGVGDTTAIYRNAHLIRAHGVDPELIADRTKYNRAHAAQLAAVAWVRYGDYLRKLHGPINLRTPDRRTTGQHLWLAGESHWHAAAKATEGQIVYLAGQVNDLQPATSKLYNFGKGQRA